MLPPARRREQTSWHRQQVKKPGRRVPLWGSSRPFRGQPSKVNAMCRRRRSTPSRKRASRETQSHTTLSSDTEVLKKKTFAACKAECLKTKGCRGVEYDKLNLKNPSEGGNEWCILAWGVDMSAGKKNSWTCHTLLIDGTQPVISAESPEALMA